METLREKYKQYCAKLDQSPVLHTAPQHDGSAHVELKDGKYNYVVTERGSEFERRRAENEDEVLYWLISDLVFDLASQYELKNRIPGQSYRRLLFSKKVELMEKLNPEWADRTRQDIQEILSEHPYDDEIEG